MKKLLLVFMFLIAPLANAATGKVSFDLQAVNLVDLVRLIYGDVLHQSFVVDEIGADLRPVTFNLREVTEAQAEAVLIDVLKTQGVTVDKRNGFAFVHRVEQKPSDVRRSPWVYRPRFRTVQYLSASLSSLFSDGTFSPRQGRAMNFSQVSGEGSSVTSGNKMSGATAQQTAMNSQRGVNALTDVDIRTRKSVPINSDKRVIASIGRRFF